MKHFLKIGEISRLYHIGPDSLRYYERLGILTPLRSESGYRLYRDSDIWKLNVIRDLRELGFGLEVIREYLENQSVDSTLQLLEAENRAIDRKIDALRALQNNVVRRSEAIRRAVSAPLERMALCHFPERRCHTTDRGYGQDQEMDLLIKELLNRAPDRLYVIGSSQIGSVIGLRQLKEQGSLQFRSVFLIDPEGPHSLPAGDYLTVRYRGSYSQSLPWGRRLLEEAARRGLTPAGDLLELLHIDVHTSPREEEHITELQLPVE